MMAFSAAFLAMRPSSQSARSRVNDGLSEGWPQIPPLVEEISPAKPILGMMEPGHSFRDLVARELPSVAYQVELAGLT